MKIRRFGVAAAALCMMLTGCSLSLNSPDILTPPKAEGNQAEIQELIKQSAGSNYEMVYPESGEYKSSVIFQNLDDDDDEEAVAMYTAKDEVISVLVADKKSNDYELLTECSIHAAKVDSVEFVSFGGDTADILLSYPGSSPSLQSLTVISVGENVGQNDMINTCAAHIVGDYNGDEIVDLLTLALADGENLPTARLFVGVDGRLEEQSSCEISSDTKEYVSLSFGKICDEMSAAVVDAIDADGKYATQLICYDYNARGVINPLYVNDGYDKTKRTAKVCSADVDRDGLIEVPLCELMDYSSTEEESSVCNRINWSNYEYADSSFANKQSAILCEDLGFLLNLPPEHTDIVTAHYTGENMMSVYLWEYKRSSPERTTKLLTVKRYPKEGFDKSKVLEAIAAENNSYVYTYVIENEEEYYRYTDDEVKNNFVLLEESPESDPQK